MPDTRVLKKGLFRKSAPFPTACGKKQAAKEKTGSVPPVHFSMGTSFVKHPEFPLLNRIQREFFKGINLNKPVPPPDRSEKGIGLFPAPLNLQFNGTVTAVSYKPCQGVKGCRMLGKPPETNALNPSKDAQIITDQAIHPVQICFFYYIILRNKKLDTGGRFPI